MRDTITAKELNKQIKKQYNLKNFNCLAALFGWGYRENVKYAITINEEKIQDLRNFETQFFELYVTHCRMIYEYLWEQGFRDIVYIKA